MLYKQVLDSKFVTHTVQVQFQLYRKTHYCQKRYWKDYKVLDSFRIQILTLLIPKGRNHIDK